MSGLGSPIVELGLVLLGLFLLEGLQWVPRGSSAFVRCPWGGYAFRKATSLREGAAGALLLPQPWAPALERFVLRPWPFAMAPDGVSFGSAMSAAWSEIESIRVEDARVVFRGRKVATFASGPAAVRSADLLRRIARAGVEEREELIREAIAAFLDPEEVRRRAGLLKEALGAAAILPWALAAHAFALGPVLGHFLGWGRVVPICIAAHVALAALAVAAAVRAARREPEWVSGGNLESVLALVLYPPATFRFLEKLVGESFSGLDPVAVAAVLMDRTRFSEVTRTRVRELRTTEQDRAIERWFDGAVRQEIEALIAREGLPRDDVFDAPGRQAGALAYCPKCRAQYREEVERCSDCAGVLLIPHSPAGAGERELEPGLGIDEEK